MLREPRETLAALGIDAATVDTVIITHLHYDHAGYPAVSATLDGIIYRLDIAPSA